MNVATGVDFRFPVDDGRRPGHEQGCRGNDAERADDDRPRSERRLSLRHACAAGAGRRRLRRSGPLAATRRLHPINQRAQRRTPRSANPASSLRRHNDTLLNNVFAIGPFRSKRTAARRRERCLETTENIGCRYVQFESLANDAKRNTQFRHLNHEEREARRNSGSFRERRGECAPTAAAALARRAGRAAPHS